MQNSPNREKSPLAKRKRLVRLGILAILAASLAIVFHRPLFFGNLGIVEPGRVFRSAQPGHAWESTIQSLKLKSVINLRGGSPWDEFYKREVEVAGRSGVVFYDLPLSATKRPSRREMMLAIAVLDQCEYPVLIHCKWGSDRTGMLSALYRMQFRYEPPEAALSSFSILHGHIPILGPEKLHEPFREYAAWLREKGLAHEPSRFRGWVETEYRAVDAFTAWPEIRSGPRVVAKSSSSIVR